MHLSSNHFFFCGGGGGGGLSSLPHAGVPTFPRTGQFTPSPFLLHVFFPLRLSFMPLLPQDAWDSHRGQTALHPLCSRHRFALVSDSSGVSFCTHVFPLAVMCIFQRRRERFLCFSVLCSICIMGLPRHVCSRNVVVTTDNDTRFPTRGFVFSAKRRQPC